MYTQRQTDIRYIVVAFFLSVIMHGRGRGVSGRKKKVNMISFSKKKKVNTGGWRSGIRFVRLFRAEGGLVPSLRRSF